MKFTPMILLLALSLAGCYTQLAVIEDEDVAEEPYYDPDPIICTAGPPHPLPPIIIPIYYYPLPAGEVATDQVRTFGTTRAGQNERSEGRTGSGRR